MRCAEQARAPMPAGTSLVDRLAPARFMRAQGTRHARSGIVS
jgi:hypothetical protein